MRLFLNLIVVFILSFISMGLGCYKPKPCPEPESHELTEKAKAAIPYLGNEVLTFINSNNDTISYYGDSSYNGYNYDIEPQANVESCSKNKYQHLNHYYRNKLGYFNVQHILRDIKRSIDDTSNSNIILIYFSKTFVFKDYLVDESSTNNYIDTLTVRGKKYEGVQVWTSIDDNSSKLYYNKKNGIVRMNIGTIQWDLKP